MIGQLVAGLFVYSLIRDAWDAAHIPEDGTDIERQMLSEFEDHNVLYPHAYDSDFYDDDY